MDKRHYRDNLRRVVDELRRVVDEQAKRLGDPDLNYENRDKYFEDAEQSHTYQELMVVFNMLKKSMREGETFGDVYNHIGVDPSGVACFLAEIFGRFTADLGEDVLKFLVEHNVNQKMPLAGHMIFISAFLLGQYYGEEQAKGESGLKGTDFVDDLLGKSGE